MKSLFALFLVLIAVKWGPSLPSLLYGSEANAPTLQFEHIMGEHFQWMEQNYSLLPAVKGVSYPEGKITAIQVGFNSLEKELQRDQLQTYLVVGVLDLIARYNNDMPVRPFLSRYPIDLNLIEYSIYQTDQKGAGLKDKGNNQTICYLYLSKGQVLYYIENDLKPGLQLLFKESFQEVLKQVKREHPNLSIPGYLLSSK